MTIDIHTHFWTDEEISNESVSSAENAGGVMARFHMTSEQHLEETSACDVSVVFGLRSAGINVSNDTVRAQVDLAPERLIFFTSVNPAEDGFMDELERTHHDLGAKGIKLGPIYQGLHPLDEGYLKIYEYAEKHNLPIVTHMSATFTNDFPLEYARPIHIDEVAMRYPDLKIIIAHMGHPWCDETTTIIRRQPNVYADLSALYYRPWQFYNTMRILVEYGTSKKVFFGSDFPFTKPSESLKGIENINDIIKGTGLPIVPEEVITDILYRDSLAILGIDAYIRSKNS